ncbi:hypothetical protein GCM10027258_33100 [Amycolatopsis stemonae]
MSTSAGTLLLTHELQPSATEAATGRWSLPVAGNVQAATGRTPSTKTWSIRASGKDAGQLSPKPSPA